MKDVLDALRFVRPAEAKADVEWTGESLFDAMVRVSLSHAERLKELGPVRVLALDPCPRCGGNVIASDDEAKCASGCGWSYRRHGAVA